MRNFIMLLLCLCFFHAHLSAQISLPFHYDKHIVLSGKVNEHFAANLVLDSGADGLYLDSANFAETGIRVQRSQQALLPGAGSTPQRIMVILDTIKTTFNGVPYIPRYTPLIALRPILGEGVDGVIGMSFLRDYIVELDYQKRMLKLMKPEEFSIPSDYEALPMETRNNRIYVDLSVGITEDDVIQEKFQIDLGNGGSLDITSPVATKYDLDNKAGKRLKYRNVSGGIGGEVQGHQFRARFIRIGSFKIDLPVVDYSSDNSGALAKEEIGGLLGNEILERFKVVFDFTNSKLYLKAFNNTKPFHSNLTGFSYTDRRKEYKGLLITGLFENTEVSEVDMRIGDVITHINGLDVNKMEMKGIRATLRRINQKVKLVVLRDGKSLNKEITVKDYL